MVQNRWHWCAHSEGPCPHDYGQGYAKNALWIMFLCTHKCS